MVVVTPTDRPQSICNRYVIEVFGGVFVLPLRFFLWVFLSCKTESDFLFSRDKINHTRSVRIYCCSIALSALAVFNMTK